ncbi:hypothetical protein [Acidimangrovimonas pyrenivorans]|uniref:Uncharacterized protein n=1 Tax=Acidimangrovimonas pyrenivorans TaxID=2030798 RepID=A0ABV7AIP7_9RHOB
MEIKCAALAAMLALAGSGASAQITTHETPGNLAPTRNPGCISVAQADKALTPADLTLGAYDCVQKADYDKAAALVILLQLRAAYDTRRVADVSAHDAGQVLFLSLHDALTTRQQTQLKQAFSRFGGTGSSNHQAFCKRMKAVGPPDYYPAYMIQHGLGAFLPQKNKPLVSNFKPRAAWSEVLTGYMKCGK